MSHATAAALGAIAGATIFIGLPIGRVRGISRAVQGFLNAVATGVLIFLLWDILTHAVSPIETALAATHHGGRSLPPPGAVFPAGGAPGPPPPRFFYPSRRARTPPPRPPCPPPPGASR